MSRPHAVHTENVVTWLMAVMQIQNTCALHFTRAKVEYSLDTHLALQVICLFVCLLVFSVTYNNISVISWRSVLLVEKTEDPEKTTDLSQATDKLYHIMLYISPWSRFELTTSVVIGTDCTDSCKFNYHTIMATTDSLMAGVVSSSVVDRDRDLEVRSSLSKEYKIGICRFCVNRNWN
jgi:hypothetical protein